MPHSDGMFISELSLIVSNYGIWYMALATVIVITIPHTVVACLTSDSRLYLFCSSLIRRKLALLVVISPFLQIANSPAYQQLFFECL